MATKRPWRSRLHANLHENISWTCLKIREGGSKLLPRLATDDFVRVVVLRTVMDDGRLILTEMTPEQAIDLGNRLVGAGQGVGSSNLKQSNGWAVNTAAPDDGWTTGTASHHPKELTWERPA